jgi:hypothetical protein
MDNADGISRNSIEDQIWIASQRHDPHSGPFDHGPPNLRRASNPRRDLADAGADPLPGIVLERRE